MDHKLQIILAAKDATKSAFLSAQGRVTAFTKSVFSLRGAMVATAGAAAMGAMIKKSLETADAIGKASDVIGISTDALQEYRHAARLAGVSTSLMDNSFKAFSKRVGEARNETGALVTFLKKFDEQLLKNIQSAGSTEEALDLFMDRMGRTAKQTDRAALAAAAFSRSGLVLTNMVKNGSAGLNKMRQEARDLGIVMDEQLIRSSEKANDEIEKLTRVIKVQFMSAAVGLAPEIAKIAQHTTDWWKANQEVVKQDVVGWVKGLTEVIKIGIIPLQIWADLWQRIGYKVGGGSAVRGMDYKGTLDDRVDKALNDFYRDLDSTIGGLPGTKTGTGQPLPDTGTPPPVSDRVDISLSKFFADIDDYFSALDEATKYQTEFEATIQSTAGQAKIMGEQLRIGIGEYIYILPEVEAATETTFSILENLSQRTAEAMEQNFSDFYFDVMRGEFEDLGDYADGVLKSIQRATADVAGQMTKEVLFGGGASGSSGLITSIGSWMFGGGRQHGGPVDPYKTYLVGEKGPELLYMGSKGGEVIPSGTARGDVSIQVNVINESGEPLQAEQGQVRFDGQQYIAEVHIDKMLHNRGYRQANRQAMR